MSHCYLNETLCNEYRNAVDPVLVFVHSQRTGGSAFTSMGLERALGRDRVYAARADDAIEAL